jgi:hypothetical protein|tara:strand:- start:55 stop:903 length:849 start_codon:yes stop_codon:yes gene_type:complete
MAALTKIAKKGIESAADFLKSFSDKIFYHGTTADIKEFKHQEKIQESNIGLVGKSGIGKEGKDFKTIETEFFHFGTPKAAQDRLDQEMFNLNIPKKNYPGGKRTNWIGQIYPVKLKAKNPLFLKDDINIPWSPDGIWKRISDDIGISGASPPTKKNKEKAKEKYNISLEELNKSKLESRRDDIYKNRYEPNNFEFDGVPFGKSGELYKGGKKQWIVDFLNSKGFDSIQYKNVHEDPGSISTMVFEPNQIRSVFAKFDPKKASSGNILASGLVGYGAFGGLED